MIKLFIPSYRRPGLAQATTFALLRNFDYKVIVQEHEYAEYAKAHPKRALLVIPKCAGLNAAREHARSLLRKGEWSLHLDDNVRGFVQAAPAFYNAHSAVPLDPADAMITRAKWQATLSQHVTFREFYDLAVLDTVRTAEQRGAWIAGFSAHENPAFRPRKYVDVGYVCGKALLLRNQGLAWNQSAESSGEDYALTAAHLYANGRVLINKWAHPLRVHYQAGGCGPYAERLPAMLRAQQELTQRYGALFGIKNANAPDRKQGELRIRFNSLAQVEQWRAALPGSPNK